MAKSPPSHIQPRFTANELARFMVTGDTGRMGLIRRARDPITPTATRYRQARNAIKAALCDPRREKAIIDSALLALEQKSDDPASTSFIRNDALKSIDAIEAFVKMRNQLSGYEFLAAPKTQEPLIIAGVEVSVYTDLVLHRTVRETDHIGAVLLRLTQSDEDETERAADKRKDMGLYSATLVHMQVAANLCGNRIPQPNLCWSVDIQNREVHVAPKTFLTRTKAMENACRFIAAVWHNA